MKSVVCCTGVMLLACALPVQAADSQTQTYVIGAEVSALGELTKTQPELGVTKPIAAVLDMALKHWRFVPAQKDGRAVPVHTFITAALESVFDADGKYTLTVRYISQGPKWEHSGFPLYSPEAMQIHAQGSVEATAELQADGKLIIKDSRTSATGRGGRLLVHGVDDALLHDRFTPETLDGTPVSAHLRTRVVFTPDTRHTGTTTYCKGHPGTIPIWCNESQADNSPPTAADRDFLEQTGFVVGIEANRTWRPGISSVLQPSMINPITMHL
ncbi:hypothetical protein IMW82_16660 [Rhodanobacter sp. B2A1Ga4]|uniref:hypothetical protein n=1 Tax=Rhodanobacter sp. B2A1Ga4 TaxID=2778647 RepID=UPI001B35D7DC|nr:hypothetical protein [Rhodanobacter sp. B2A1Ga4]MBQ4856301.1 hypothetical protein [Rhodanobacter sp. B2A1Ga4]